MAITKVTKEKFWEKIGTLNISVTPVGEYPYKTNFTLKNGILVGFIQDTDDPNISHYYLVDNSINENKISQ